MLRAVATMRYATGSKQGKCATAAGSEPMTQTTQTIKANGIDLCYALEGPEDAPVVMLSNSLASNLAMWDAQMAALADKYRVLRYDQRGHGGTQVTPPPYNFDLLVDDAVGLIQVLGFTKVHFCGLSMGGMTGQLFGVKYPELLSSLILCDTASQMPDPSIWDERIDAARNQGMTALAPATLERWFTAPYRETETGEIARVNDMIASTPVDGFIGCCNAIAAMNFTPILKDIRTPTLVIVGADDPSTTVEHSRIIHEAIDGSELCILDQAAHLSNIEQADAFNAALRAFLDKQ
jgi:3-oxoadipate enol-lactonase